MTTPTGGTPAPPPPPPYTSPATRRRETFRNVGIIAILVAIVFFVLTQCGGMNVSFDDASSEETSTSESASPSETAPPSPVVNDPEAEVPPVVAAHDIASCGVIWSWKSFDDCVDKVASWMPAEWDKHKDVSKVPYAHVEDWAKRFPNAEARVFFVYNDQGPAMTDDEVRAKGAAEAKLDPSVAARLQIVRVERDFPGWFVINTGNLENQRMNRFRDDRPEQVRVSLAPLNDKGEIDLRMAGSGAFVTCFNLHWLEQDKPAPSSPPGTSTCCASSTTTTTTPSTKTTTTTPSTSTTTTTPSTSTTTTTTSTTTTQTTTTQTSPPKDPDGGPSTSIVMPPPDPTDAETTPPPPSPTPLDPTVTTDAPTVAPPVETYEPPPVPTDLPPATSTVTTVIDDPGSQG